MRLIRAPKSDQTDTEGWLLRILLRMTSWTQAPSGLVLPRVNEADSCSKERPNWHGGVTDQDLPQNDLQDPSDLGPGFRKASSGRQRQQVAASREQEQGCKAPDMTQSKFGENVKWMSCYSTQSRAARNRKNVNDKSNLPELALVLSAWLPVSPAAFFMHQKWRGVRNAPFAWLWHSATRGRQKEKYSPVIQGCQS